MSSRFCVLGLKISFAGFSLNWKQIDTSVILEWDYLLEFCYFFI